MRLLEMFIDRKNELYPWQVEKLHKKALELEACGELAPQNIEQMELKLGRMEAEKAEERANLLLPATLDHEERGISIHTVLHVASRLLFS